MRLNRKAERKRLVDLIMRSGILQISKPIAEKLATKLLRGGVFVPPCRVGQTIYYNRGAKTYEGTCGNIEIWLRDPRLRIEIKDFENNYVYYLAENVHMTKEHAEEARKILGYRYGNSPEIHDSLPDYDESIVVVYKNGETRGYDYIDGNLIRPRC